MAEALVKAESASPFIIKELGGQNRTVSLIGRALPFRPFTLGGSQRAEFVWYPGNPVATVQVLGPSEDETTINGRWSDQFLTASVTQAGASSAAIASVGTDEGDLLPTTSCTTLCGIIDDIRRQGQQLEVRWGPQIRRGILTKFRMSWQREEIVEWEMTFAWYSQGDEKPTITLPSASLTGLGNQVGERVEALDEAVNRPKNPFEATQVFRKKLNEYVGKITAAYESIEDAVYVANDGTVGQVHAVERAVAALQTIKDSAVELVGYVASQVAHTAKIPSQIKHFVVGGTTDTDGESYETIAAATLPQTPSGEGFAAASFTLAECMLTKSYMRGIAEAARELRAFASEQIYQMIASAEWQGTEYSISRNRDEEIIVGREGMDLRDLARSKLGDQTEWRKILRYNGLESSKVEVGQTIRIPRGNRR